MLSSIARRLGKAEAQTETLVSASGEIRGFTGILIVFVHQDDVNTGNAGLLVDHAALIRALCDVERGGGCAIAYCGNAEPLNPLIWAPPSETSFGRTPFEPS